MLWRFIRLDAVCCSNVMSTRLQNLGWTAASSLLEAMRLQQIRPDVVCVGAVLATLREATSWMKAVKILRSYGAESTVCCNASLTACATRPLEP